ncbi:class I SAM-dependent methyltransferase [Sediminicurvatus halobius]|uniref:Methyltransferase domain-containing protein n=1 Tax=Sediminicurvatus halobius TaxID=2182432 RepID=A0A2U2N4D3_9GAMM|nr:class I SAM-dependent methyltransferase [Spiribacter halobius]PWG63888.1 hypothetical protein DEM34_06720 [Spiribacter halobius]UEX76298.1 class I SAM-dependent methyltransferase [Spiribacter halobius]
MSATSIDYDPVAEIYDLYVTAVDDVPFFLQEAQAAAGPVLELTAGTGRLSLPLIEAGVALTCVDVSPRMLEVLDRKLRQRGLRAELRCADICQLELPARFRLALLPFQSFMEITGEARQRQALAAVHRCLLPGGRFICTLHNPALRRRQVDGTLRLVGRFPHREGSLVVSGFETGGQPVVNRLQFFECFGADGSLRWKRLLPMRFELIERERFAAMARDAGFRVRDVHGHYDRSPFDPARSPFMIWVLEKKGSERGSRRPAIPHHTAVED